MSENSDRPSRISEFVDSVLKEMEGRNGEVENKALEKGTKMVCQIMTADATGIAMRSFMDAAHAVYWSSLALKANLLLNCEKGIRDDGTPPAMREALKALSGLVRKWGDRQQESKDGISPGGKFWTDSEHV